jgi:hypothetical protein
MIGYGTLLILIPKGTDVQYKRNRKYSGWATGRAHATARDAIAWDLYLGCHPLSQHRASCPVFLLLEAGAQPQHYAVQHYSLSRSTGPPCIKAAVF